MLSASTSLVAQDSIEEVWARLLSAAGRDDFEPELVVSNSSEFGPAYYGNSQVTIDARVVDLFGQLDSSSGSIAYILAHELAHHKRGHIPTFFAKRSLRGTSAGNLDSEVLRIRDESEADNLAGLYCYLADYEMPNMSLVLDSVYSHYSIPESLPGYPTLHERKQIAEQTQVQIEQITKAYDLALTCSALKLYEQSNFLLETLVRDVRFNPAEVYDLLSANLLFQALDEMSEEIDLLKRWHWPIVLSSRPGEVERLTRSIGDEAKDPLKLLDEAREYARKGEEKRWKEGYRPPLLPLIAFFEELWLDQGLKFRELPAECSELGDEEKCMVEAFLLQKQGKSKKAAAVLSGDFSDFSDIARLNLSIVREGDIGATELPQGELHELLKPMVKETISEIIFGIPNKRDVRLGRKSLFSFGYLDDGIEVVKMNGKNAATFIFLPQEAIANEIKLPSLFELSTFFDSGHRIVSSVKLSNRIVLNCGDGVLTVYGTSGKLDSVIIAVD